MLAAVRLEFALLRRSPDYLLPMVTAPLFTVVFVAITRHAGRPDLTGYAVLAPAVLAVLGMALLTSGEVVSSDRAAGTLELLLAVPAPVPLVVFGRVAVVTVISLAAIVESWLVAWLGFGVRIPVAHPSVFVLALIGAALGTAGVATGMAAVFVITRTARTFQNSLSYPLYLLGGALVPVSLLPAWLQPATRLVFLSWATDLMRDSLHAGPVPDPARRLLILAGLAALGYAAGFWLLARLVDRVRRTGAVGFE